MMAAVTYSMGACRLVPSDPLRPRSRARGILADGPGPPQAAPHARPALLEAPGHRTRADDDALGGHAAVGDVRRLGRRGRPRRVPRLLGRRGPLAHTRPGVL